MADALVWLSTLLMLILVTAPAFSFLFLAQGWESRRREILDSLSDQAVKRYFKTFHPQRQPASATRAGFRASETREDGEQLDARAELAYYYNSQFGRRAFAVPLTIFVAAVGLVLVWSAASVRQMLGLVPASPGALPPVALSALMGAYLWVAYDQISRWSDLSHSPDGLSWSTFRLAIAVPMGFAFAATVKEGLAMPLVFLIGAFPTNTLLTIVRRAGLQLIGPHDTGTAIGEQSQLQRIQGVDARNAEAFAAVGVTTLLQLAYCDPIRLAILTNLGFSFVNDCVGQALWWIYVEDKFEAMREFGLRGSFECVTLYRELEQGSENEQREARALVEQIASDLQMRPEALLNVLSEVGEDPYAKFLYETWVDDDLDEDDEDAGADGEDEVADDGDDENEAVGGEDEERSGRSGLNRGR